MAEESQLERSVDIAPNVGGGVTVKRGGETDGDLMVGLGKIDDSSSTSIGTAREAVVGGMGITSRVAVAMSAEVVVGERARSGGEGGTGLGATSRVAVATFAEMVVGEYACSKGDGGTELGAASGNGLDVEGSTGVGAGAAS